MSSEQKQYTVRELRRIHGALSILGNRFAPSISSDIRVSRLLGPASKALDPYEQTRAKSALQVAENEGISIRDAEKLSGLAQQLLLAKITLVQDEAELQLVEVNFPDLRLTQADLPKERTGDDGWKNGAQLGAIISDLGDLFELPKE